jgi:pilus assembly protein Flp/PilA
MRLRRGFVRWDEGATAVEYSLLAAAIAAVVVALVWSIGHFTKKEFDVTCTSIKGHSNATVETQATCS